uniref:Uncharacterized protein n=1 Tax=Cacopsylla melanoneura TaxID=428564 RepID=A0A8D8YTL5_9HEMI
MLRQIRGPVKILLPVLSHFSFIKEKEIPLSKLIAIGCDGTNVNTGKNNGLIKRVEQFVGHRLHWFVCLLHVNELPLRLFQKKLMGKLLVPNNILVLQESQWKRARICLSLSLSRPQQHYRLWTRQTSAQTSSTWIFVLQSLQAHFQQVSYISKRILIVL